MARVNVEQKALTDARFYALGKLLGAKNSLARFTGIGVMTAVWNQCQERGRKTLTRAELDGAASIEGLWMHVIEAELGEEAEEGCVRVRGTDGRIEWLEKNRENGAKGKEFGVLGGRPRKTPDAVPQNPERGGARGSATKPPLSLSLPSGSFSGSEERKPSQDFSKGRDEITKGQYLFLAEQVGRWIEGRKNAPMLSASEYDRAFEARFQMTPEAWDALKAKHGGATK